MDRAAHDRATLLPIVAVLAGLCTFSIMDGVMKQASILLGAFGALFWRSVVGSAIMVPLWWWSGRNMPSMAVLRLHALRAVVATAMAVLFFYGVVRTPLAEGMALSFIAPLIALYLAAAMLGEKVGRRALLGSAVALAGVGVIAAGKFGGRYEAESIRGLAAILASAVLYAWNLVLQRRQAQVAGPQDVAMFQNLFACMTLGLGAWWWAPLPAPADWSWIAGGAILAVGSLMVLSWAYARAEAQVLVPLEYTAFIWAAGVGWLMFHEPVTSRTLTGVILIVAGCLIAAQRPRGPAEPA